MRALAADTDQQGLQLRLALERFESQHRRDPRPPTSADLAYAAVPMPALLSLNESETRLALVPRRLSGNASRSAELAELRGGSDHPRQNCGARPCAGRGWRRASGSPRSGRRVSGSARLRTRSSGIPTPSPVAELFVDTPTSQTTTCRPATTTTSPTIPPCPAVRYADAVAQRTELWQPGWIVQFTSLHEVRCTDPARSRFLRPADGGRWSGEVLRSRTGPPTGGEICVGHPARPQAEEEPDAPDRPDRRR